MAQNEPIAATRPTNEATVSGILALRNEANGRARGDARRWTNEATETALVL
jgi:hypothetical protein